MYKILDDAHLNASIKSFVSRKFDKFDIPELPSQAKNGIRSQITQSKQAMKDCVSGEYFWHGDASPAR